MLKNKFIITISFIIICFLPGTLFSQNWEQKASLPAQPRYGSFSFSIGNKGYIGIGQNENLEYFNDFWEYNTDSNTWRKIGNFPGIATVDAAGFSIDKKGYVVCGDNQTQYVKELWEWDGDPVSATYNTWTRKADFPELTRVHGVTFTIGKKAYLGPASYSNQLWQWDGDTASATYNTWTKMADYPGGVRILSTGFSIGKKGYVGTGSDGSNFKNDFWEWDGDTGSVTYNTWVRKADVPGGPRGFATGFNIGNYGYIGLGLDVINNIITKYFWKYNPIDNSWTSVPDFPATGRENAVAFVINNRAYVGTGYDHLATNDLWEYCDTCLNLGYNQINYLNKNLQIFPNPANNEITLCVSGKIINKLFLYDLTGRELMQSKSTTINIGTLPKGIYFIKAQTDKGLYLSNFVKE